jgi:hypothetical protein
MTARDVKGEITELEFVGERGSFQAERLDDLAAGDDATLRNLLGQARTNIHARAHKGYV